MIRQLTIDEILELARQTPEQAVYDWKRDFVPPTTDEARGEIVKDVAAVANSLTTSYGFILFGIDPQREDPLCGITTRYDDARLQQLLQGKIEPPVDFLYYEVSHGPKTIGVIQIAPTRKRPYVIRVDLGKVRKGMIVIRRGSSTDGITLQDLLEFFYGAASGYFPDIVQRLGLDVAQQRAATERLRELRERQNDLLKQAEIAAGMPPGTLGARW